jgi:predicted RNA-binding Zn ribbon-like protein
VTVGRREAGDPAGLGLSSLAYPDERQVGGRRPAPGELALVQGFVNTSWNLDDGNRERFTSPEAIRAWMDQRELLEPGIKLGARDMSRVLDVRFGLRSMMFSNNGAAVDTEAIDRLNDALGVTGPTVRLHPTERPDFRVRRDGLDQALAVIAAVVAVAQLDGRWPRLKACRGIDCGWAFYDHSRNQGSNWCAMSVCGARAKAREYRGRQRRGD